MHPGPENPGSDPLAASAHADAAAASPARSPWLSWLLVAAVALVAMAVVRGLLVQSFYVPSGSMQPTIEPGDRILVNKTIAGSGLERGDIVVFDGTGTFAVGDRTPPRSDGVVGRVLADAATLVGVRPGEQDFVKRIVGLPGDRVACCDPEGRITVNGAAVAETYLPLDEAPSELRFDVVVPRGRIWVMGDHRSNSADSRAHLGDPGGGMVLLDDVIGRASLTYWPLSRLGTLDTPAELSTLPRQPEQP